MRVSWRNRLPNAKCCSLREFRAAVPESILFRPETELSEVVGSLFSARRRAVLSQWPFWWQSWWQRMMGRIREASSSPRARITGIVYLLYFLTAMLAEILAGRKLVAYGNAANLIATGCYVVLTLLFYGMFKPVNRSLSLIGALFSLEVEYLTFFCIFAISLCFGPYSS